MLVKPFQKMVLIMEIFLYISCVGIGAFATRLAYLRCFVVNVEEPLQENSGIERFLIDYEEPNELPSTLDLFPEGQLKSDNWNKLNARSISRTSSDESIEVVFNQITNNQNLSDPNEYVDIDTFRINFVPLQEEFDEPKSTGIKFKPASEWDASEFDDSEEANDLYLAKQFYFNRFRQKLADDEEEDDEGYIF